MKQKNSSTVLQATVTQIQNKQAQVTAGGRHFSCLLPASLVSAKNALVVGDRVGLEPVGSEQYRVTRILPRETSLYRGDRRTPGAEILVAANIQALLAIVTADCLLHQAGYLESAALAAGRAGISYLVLISKWDLVGEQTQALLRKKLEVLRQFSGGVFTEPEALVPAVKGITTAVVGDRACGKTTAVMRILTALQGGILPSQPLSSTHSSRLYPGPEDTCLIDTPGFREFALQEITGEELQSVFPEIARLAEDCPYTNCTHTHEEGCRVLEALRNKELPRERYDAFRKLGGGFREAPKKPDYRHSACVESFVCKVCGAPVAPDGAGSQHRNHCPKCLSSLHVDQEPGDRASLCGGIMDPVSVWVRKGGEWAVIHRCRLCGALSSNRIAADDNPALLLSIAVKPLAMTPFPLNKLEEVFGQRD